MAPASWPGVGHSSQRASTISEGGNDRRAVKTILSRSSFIGGSRPSRLPPLLLSLTCLFSPVAMPVSRSSRMVLVIFAWLFVSHILPFSVTFGTPCCPRCAPNSCHSPKSSLVRSPVATAHLRSRPFLTVTCKIIALDRGVLAIKPPLSHRFRAMALLSHYTPRDWLRNIIWPEKPIL